MYWIINYLLLYCGLLSIDIVFGEIDLVKQVRISQFIENHNKSLTSSKNQYTRLS